ncbi:hypothetical protein D3C85_1849090 [compost metagenome]
MHFPAGSLGGFHNELGEINFKVRYPGGGEDLARERANEGGFISRRALCMLTGNPAVEDWFIHRGVPSDKLD